MKDRRKYNKMVRNSFCPTGPGGGVDPSCSPSSSSSIKELSLKETDALNTWKLNAWGKVKSSQKEGTELGKVFNDAINKLPSSTADSFRCIALHKSMIDTYKLGSVIDMKHSESFSGSKEFAEGWAAEHPSIVGPAAMDDRIPAVIQVPPSTKMRHLGGVQQELVNLPGLKLKVISTQLKDNVLYIHTKELTPITNAHKKPSPTKFDPTRTTSLRRAFVGKLRRKFALLHKAIYDLLVTEDALGLKKNLTYNCRPGQIRGADGRCGPGIGVDIPRDEMPQITQEDLTAFLTFASHENVQVLARHCLARQLRPTQKEFRQERVDAMPDAALEQPVIVSRDLYVLDGTHRWIKHWQQDEDKLVPLLIIQLDLHQALDLMRRFPLSKFVANHIVKLSSGKYRLLSHEGKNLGTFDSREEAAKHEGEVEYFKQANNERWRFNTTPEQLQAFKEWLKTQVEYYITGMSDEQLWNKFIESGFKKGAGRAFDDTKPQTQWTEAEGAFYAGTKDQFLRSAFGQPESVEKVQLLAARTFEELKGMSADLQTKVGRILVDGLTKGDGPVAIAREMGKQLELSRTRAETIAQTELIRAHAEGQLSGLEELGVEEVGVMVEWSTAADDRVCDLCEPMEGIVLKIEEARGMIPRHPRCRCAFTPANVGEPTDDQKRGKRKIVKAVKVSASLGRDEFSTAVPVTKERPKSVLPVITNKKPLFAFDERSLVKIDQLPKDQQSALAAFSRLLSGAKK